MKENLYIQDNYGEPFNHGWGIDLPGFGESLKFKNIQAHTLKPFSTPNSDGHMKYEDQQIKVNTKEFNEKYFNLNF